MKKIGLNSIDRARRIRSLIPSSPWAVSAITACFLVACGSNTQVTPLDAPADRAPDQATDTVNKDLPPEQTGCVANGRNYIVGSSVTLAGDCPSTCTCMSNGTLGRCTNACGPEVNPPYDTQPPLDLPVTCTKSGKTYATGEIVPIGDGCGGSCVCLADGTLGRCSGACVDAGPDLSPDIGPDGKPDQAQDLPPEVEPIDTACAFNVPCNVAGGGRGLCSAGVCKACAGAQDDATCVAVYGAGSICGGGRCVVGTCHDARACTGNRVCDSTFACKACSADSQCQEDAAYGNSYICLANGQCVPGTCHTSSDCQSKKLCNATSHTCNTCSNDAQCQADTAYGASSMCVAGQCVAGACTTSTDCRGSGRLCPTTKVCAECTTDTQCKNDTAYGANTICVSGQCVTGVCNDSSQCPNGRMCNTTQHACVACATDTQCKNDANYGQHTLCLAGACTVGDCHDASSECSSGRICGSSVPHACGDCTTDAQCKQDPRYQNGYLCVANLCVKGDCHDTSTECTATKAGLVCGARTPHTCGTCAEDDQCKNDPKFGANTMCITSAGLGTTGQCVSNACTNTGKACAGNSADVCCGNKCIAGNCCADADCHANPVYGDNFLCRQNTCTRCDSVAGNAYFVDPVNGNDNTATGSGKAGGAAVAACSFRTVTRALQAIGTAPAGTTITLVGRAGATTALYTTPATGDTSPTETLPIQVPANVTITTMTGPVKLTLASNKVGFSLLGNLARLLPVSSAALTIDGANHASASGIVVTAAAGTASIANVTVSNTGDDGIQVTSGTAQIGAGVRVTGAGTATSKQSGLLISGGTANIVVAATETPTVFEDNTESGIAVSGAGMLNITGATVTTGVRTVVAQHNAGSNVNFAQTPVNATTTSTINGLYAFASTGDGLLISAGSKIKVRSSVFLANGGNGIRIAAGATSNSLATIDLGIAGATAGNAGRNILQAPAGGNPNIGAGLCVNLGANAGTQNLAAVGNLFANRDCSTANPGVLRTSANCTGAVDLATASATGTTVDVNVNNCTKP